MDEFLNTQQAADYLKVSPRRIQAMIKQGLFPATKFGRDWMIRAEDLKRFAQQPRQPGRPRKPRPSKTAKGL